MAFILAAIPLFFILIGIELAIDKKRGTGYYQFNDAINSLQLGILSRVTGILKAMLPLSIYFYCYENWRLFSLDDNDYVVWALAFIGYDLGYYWVHRLSHRINVMWGSHVVHHSSEEYNLTTALRQTSTPALFGGLVYLPLAFLGISPLLLIACSSLNLIYQFWVHTRHINKMPAWFEAVFVTPSHHRVHHALNRDYIDKNFAGVFIVWDKLFGSFQEEKDDVKTVYGVSHQLKSWNPIWANFQVYRNLLQDALSARAWRDKCLVWFKPPGWRPDDAAAAHPRKYVTTKTMKKYDVVLSMSEKYYVLVQHIGIILFTLALLLSLSMLSATNAAMLAIFVMFSLFVVSCLQEKRQIAMSLEIVRLIVTAGLIVWFSPAQWQLLAVITAILFLSGSLGALFRNSKTHQQQLSTEK